jgi:5-formyltetrahydrofolate cyclo-ligase
MADGAGKAHIKSELRQLLRQERQVQYREHSLLHIAEFPEVRSARMVASYFSYGYEPETFALNQRLLAAGKSLILPRVNGESLEWVLWDGDLKNISKSGLISEPIGQPISDINLIEVMLIPALAIDLDGYRLGQGRGFYDRALTAFKGETIGIVFAHEIMEQPLPRDSWDMPLGKSATAL